MTVYRKKKAAPTEQVYLTPLHIKGHYADWFDPCPHPHPPWDGLELSWGDRAFCNPPWCNIRPWVEKALYGTTSFFLERVESSFSGATHRIYV